MWIKASGTELADAEMRDIFVAVDVTRARAEAYGADDGTCRAALVDPDGELRPSIETTFHATLDWPVVAHTHSIATLVHAIAPRGRAAADDKLDGLPYVRVPYAKPGLPLTEQILSRVSVDTQVVLLENHGLICAGASVAETAALVNEVEARLALPDRRSGHIAIGDAPDGFVWNAESWMAHDARIACHVTRGSYYPDHVVFLGPAFATVDGADKPPALLVPDRGVALRHGTTSAQAAMLTCLADVMARLPESWLPEPIGAAAEADLLNWDAEKYRQKLAGRT